MDAENFEKLMKERHSVRYFQKKGNTSGNIKKNYFSSFKFTFLV